MKNQASIQDISKKIYLRRMELGYSQSYMADQLNISQNIYSINERNLQKISLDRFFQILQVLELTDEEVMEQRIED